MTSKEVELARKMAEALGWIEQMVKSKTSADKKIAGISRILDNLRKQ